MDGSDLLTDMGKHLNTKARAFKNWRHVACQLKIPPDICDAFENSKAKAKSPTTEMFKTLAKLRPDLTVNDLLHALQEIKRFDVKDIVREEINGEFKMKDP